MSPGESQAVWHSTSIDFILTASVFYLEYGTITRAEGNRTNFRIGEGSEASKLPNLRQWEQLLNKQGNVKTWSYREFRIDTKEFENRQAVI